MPTRLTNPSQPLAPGYLPGANLGSPILHSAIYLAAGEDGNGTDFDRCVLAFGENGLTGIPTPAVNDVVVITSIRIWPIGNPTDVGLAEIVIPFSESDLAITIPPNDSPVSLREPFIDRESRTGLFRWVCPSTVTTTSDTQNFLYIRRAEAGVSQEVLMSCTWYYERAPR